MDSNTFSFTYQVFSSSDELNEADRKLLDLAAESAEKSYSHYSGYHVGASLLLENGEIVQGSNQENVAYPSGMCAERVAAFYASANYPDMAFNTLAIRAFSDDFEVSEPVTPCGSCRQVLVEYEDKHQQQIRILMQGAKGKVYLLKGARNLLPLTFNETKLKK